MLSEPAIVCGLLSFARILVELYNGNASNALLQACITAVFMVLLELLCRWNHTVIAWFMVLIPFLFMTVIASILLMATAKHTTTTPHAEVQTTTTIIEIPPSSMSSAPEYQS